MIRFAGGLGRLRLRPKPTSVLFTSVVGFAQNLNLPTHNLRRSNYSRHYANSIETSYRGALAQLIAADRIQAYNSNHIAQHLIR